jgi:voltage-gated potassium channel Kch
VALVTRAQSWRLSATLSFAVRSAGQRLAPARGACVVALDSDSSGFGAAAAGENVVYGDASRRETLIAAGVVRASALVVTFADTQLALRILHHVRALNPALPAIVRTLDDADMDRLIAAGAAEVVPETFESSLMLASHALVLLGVPLRRVVRRIRDVREQRYSLMRGFFHGGTDEAEDPDEAREPRLQSVTLVPGSGASGRSLGELGLDELGVQVTALRRSEHGWFHPRRRLHCRRATSSCCSGPRSSSPPPKYGSCRVSLPRGGAGHGEQRLDCAWVGGARPFED